MTSIEYKLGMVKALKDLSGELGNDFWSNESYCKDGKSTREASFLYVRTCEMINKRILAIEAEINQEFDELSKQDLSTGDGLPVLKMTAQKGK